MIQFAIGCYGDGDWRLVKYDGTDETEVGSGWAHRPDFEECLNALADHHSVGSTPFSSREGMIDAHVLTAEWPLSKRDVTVEGETLPWDD